MSDTSSVLNEFFTRGFQVFRNSELANHLNDYPLESIQWTDDGSEQESEFYKKFPLGPLLLSNVQIYIANQYLCETFEICSFIHKRLWSGFTEDQLIYHNDTYKETEDNYVTGNRVAAKYNILALLYLSDMTSQNEGAVWFRNDKEEFRILPERGMLILVNCSLPSFQHKGEWTNRKRYLAQFGFSVDQELLLNNTNKYQNYPK